VLKDEHCLVFTLSFAPAVLEEISIYRFVTREKGV
jgi:hypothetical protein